MIRDREKWVNEILGSAAGIQPPAANPFLHSRVMAKLATNQREQIPVRLAWLAFAGLALLAAFNIGVMASRKAENISIVLSEYNLDRTVDDAFANLEHP